LDHADAPRTAASKLAALPQTPRYFGRYRGNRNVFRR
jgi:hypothetical protein